MSTKSRGFTLIEMLVVITIILILMALLAVLIKNVKSRAENKNTNGIVAALRMGCENYRTDERVYPPQTYTGFTGSQALHFLLGRERKVRSSSGPSGTIVKRDPYLEFPPNWLEGNPASSEPNPPKNVIDAWGNVIQYSNPAPGTSGTPPSYLIVSYGRDGVAGSGDEVYSSKAED